MELLAADSTAYTQSSRTYRHSCVSDLAMALLFGLFLIGMGYGLVRAGAQIPWLLWLLLGPIALLCGLLFALISSTAAAAFVAGLKPGNWHARVGPSGLHLNLRSYRNAHFSGDEATVVFLSFGEIEAIARIDEIHLEQRRDGRIKKTRAYIELELAGVDTTSLEDAIRSERDREAPMHPGWIGSSSTKHHHYPVFCPRPGVVWTDWHRGLFRALSARVRVEPRRTSDLGAELAGEPLSARVEALTTRGRRLAAQRLRLSEATLDDAQVQTPER